MENYFKLINDPRLPWININEHSLDNFKDVLEDGFKHIDDLNTNHKEEIEIITNLYNWINEDKLRYKAIEKYLLKSREYVDLHEILGNLSIKPHDIGLSDLLIYSVQRIKIVGWTKPVRHGHNDAPLPDPIIEYYEKYSIIDFYNSHKEEIDKFAETIKLENKNVRL